MFIYWITNNPVILSAVPAQLIVKMEVHNYVMKPRITHSLIKGVSGVIGYSNHVP
jgi:hypothetical protein